MKDINDLKKKYKVGSTLGEGNFSVVRECSTKPDDHCHYAIKIVKLKGKKEKKENIKAMMQSEISIMQKLDHNNIVKCIEAFQGADEIAIVLEGTRGGDLYDHIVNLQGPDERTARYIANDIANAVHYLHALRIVHRDIKPENFLVFYLPNGEVTVKLCDFGLAMDARQFLTEVCGSPSYVAPEVLRMENYGLPVDIWSCGIVFYVLLCHFPPFYADNTRRLFSNIMKGSFDFPSPYWDDISGSAKDLVTKMLVLRADKRLTAEEIVSHPWFAEMQRQEHTKSQIEKKASPLTLRSIAMAVRCMQRLAEPVLAPARERAILSKSFLQGCDLEKH